MNLLGKGYTGKAGQHNKSYEKERHIDGNHDNNENDDGVGGREAGRRETAINRAQGCDDPFGEWITDCVLMATRLEPNNGQTAHTK